MGVEAEVGKGVNARVEKKEKRMARQKYGQIINSNADDKNVDGFRRGNAQSVTVVARSATKRCHAPDRCVALAAEKAIRLRHAPTSSPSLPVKLTRVAATVMGS